MDEPGNHSTKTKPEDTIRDLTELGLHAPYEVFPDSSVVALLSPIAEEMISFTDSVAIFVPSNSKLN
jgi:hypothetical protein